MIVFVLCIMYILKLSKNWVLYVELYELKFKNDDYNLL